MLLGVQRKHIFHGHQPSLVGLTRYGIEYWYAISVFNSKVRVVVRILVLFKKKSKTYVLFASHTLVKACQGIDLSGVYLSFGNWKLYAT